MIYDGGDALAIVPDYLLSLSLFFPLCFICRISACRVNANSTTVCVHCSWCCWVCAGWTIDADFHCEVLQEIPHEEGATESVQCEGKQCHLQFTYLSLNHCYSCF